MKEATKAELKEVFSLKRIMWVLIGNTIYSCGIAAFVLPNDLITGGTTGIALILEHYFGLPIGLSVAIFNIVMFILAILILEIICAHSADQYVLFPVDLIAVSKSTVYSKYDR